MYTDVLGGPFADCVGSVRPKPRLFLWHKWPDEALVHGHQDDKDGPSLVAVQTKKTIHHDDFWSFVDRLRQGRRLVITGDHGYADASSFSNEEKRREHGQAAAIVLRGEPLRQGRPRQAVASPASSALWSAGTTAGWWSWASASGRSNTASRSFATAALSLLEAAVPFIEYPPK